ncbi:MAG: hypothetical protein WCG75_08415, partial [Armatimonadota bacterium]
NNFDWSGWDDSDDALKELEPIRIALLADRLPPESRMAHFFLPTGPLQEVSISSGWGDEFIDLANRFDAALIANDCNCFQNPQGNDIQFEYVDSMSDYAEIYLGKCSSCGQEWLRYFYEDEGFTSSGRSYVGAISADQAKNLDKEQAKSILNSLAWHWYGGSYYDGKVGRSSSTIL